MENDTNRNYDQQDRNLQGRESQNSGLDSDNESLNAGTNRDSENANSDSYAVEGRDYEDKDLNSGFGRNSGRDDNSDSENTDADTDSYNAANNQRSSDSSVQSGTNPDRYTTGGNNNPEENAADFDERNYNDKQ